MNRTSQNLLCIMMVACLALSACEQPTPDESPAEAPDSEASEAVADKNDVAPPKVDDSDHGHDHAAVIAQAPTSLDELPDNVNAVEYEMILLNEAMLGVFTMIVNNTLQGIPPTIHGIHDAADLTHEALTSGQYKPPKNSEDVEGFEKLDEAFHDDLVKLVEAAEEDNLELVTETYTDLVQGCTNCHTQYRF